MTRSLLTRRTLLHTSGVIASGGVAVAAVAEAAPSAAAQSDIAQSEDGVVCHPEVGRSDLMKGFPPPADKRVSIDNYGSSTEMMRWAMLHPATVFHTREVDRGSVPVRALPRHTVDPEKVDSARVNWGKGGEVTVAEWLRGSGTDAFVALHDGHIVAEQYFGEMTPETQHRVFSIAKSFTAAAGAEMLANQTVDERELASHYVPELEQTAYQGATVRQLLDMQVSIRYEYFCPADEKAKGHEKAWEMGTPEFRRAQHAQARYQRICGMMRKLEGEENVGAYDVLFELKERTRPHGEVCSYACPTSLAFQLILERVSGRSMIELLSTQLWQRLGAERPAIMQIDDLGTALPHGGLALTARDLARWGQMLLDNGRVGSEQVVPSAFVDDIPRHPNREQFENSMLSAFFVPGCGYRSYFLVAPQEPTGQTPFWAGGGWGQWCFIDVARRNVIVKFSTEPDIDIGQVRDFLAIRSLSEALPALVG